MKQLKLYFKVKYFLGGIENAIKTVIYCALIDNLQKTVIKKRPYSNLIKFCRIHIFNYKHLLTLIENTDKG